MKINLKKKSHVKGYALRGAGLRKQVSFVCLQLSIKNHKVSHKSALFIAK